MSNSLNHVVNIKTPEAGRALVGLVAQYTYLPPGYDSALSEAVAIVQVKNRGYGRETDPWHNFRAGEAIGVSPARMAFLRCLEKTNRLSSYFSTTEHWVASPSGVLKNGVDPREEALDLANLALIVAALVAEEQEKEAGK
jgi:hypothetical protein